MNQPLEKTNSAAPVPILGTWDSARTWLDYSKRFEQCKLWAQVMLGFELIELKRRHGVKHGSNQHSSSQVGKSWTETLEEELKIPHTSAYRCEEMARAAAPRLKKMINAKDIDLINTPLSKLTVPMQKSLGDAVHKLTDGKSQTDFFNDLYKNPTGNLEASGKGGKKLSPEETAEKLKDEARADSGQMGVSVNASNRNFFLNDDLEVTSQVALLEAALKFRRAWLAQPKGKRDAGVIEKMVKEAK